MVQQETHFYEFGRFRLDATERVLLRDRELVPLTPKVFDILLALVEHGGHLVEKEDLMKRVWPDSFVEEGNLTQNVSLLRKAFKLLEKAYEERDIWLMNLKVDPVFSKFRSDRRFPDLLARTGLRP